MTRVLCFQKTKNSGKVNPPLACYENIKYNMYRC